MKLFRLAFRPGLLCCVFTLTVPLSAQEWRQNAGGVICDGLASHPGGVEILLVGFMLRRFKPTEKPISLPPYLEKFFFITLQKKKKPQTVMFYLALRYKSEVLLYCELRTKKVLTYLVRLKSQFKGRFYDVRWAWSNRDWREPWVQEPIRIIRIGRVKFRECLCACENFTQSQKDHADDSDWAVCLAEECWWEIKWTLSMCHLKTFCGSLQYIRGYVSNE